jgi:hypothetical protein
MRIWAVPAVLLTFVVLVFANDSAAHTGAPTFDVQEASAHGRTIRLRVAVTYSVDGDAAEGAFLTAVPIAPDGRPRPAIDMRRRSRGVYVLETEVDSDGRWTFQITSRFPSGSTEVPVDVGRAPADDDGRAGWLVPAAVGAALVLGAAAAALLRRRRRAGS